MFVFQLKKLLEEAAFDAFVLIQPDPTKEVYEMADSAHLTFVHVRDDDAIKDTFTSTSGEVCEDVYDCQDYEALIIR